ncbi:MAG: phosphoribosylaminoimidazolesuccinocarboxamide synthase [Fimbriimonadaceae bacterium]|nr:phosphoribosylaminoimidazolesuccinocarboxamide synthase [Fimbriimonadaceae bacterium]
MSTALMATSLPNLPPPRKGKVREVYDLGDQLLFIASDRISAFDVIMANGIPDKGRVLTQISAFWFDKLQHIVPHHMISIDPVEIASKVEGFGPDLYGRSMLVKKAKTVPVECVARGYITGSLFKEYKRLGPDVHGLKLPTRLVDGSQLPEPIFSPASKAETGHDENMSFAEMINVLGRETAEQLRDWTLKLYTEASEYTATKGLILADTKFEFGVTDDGIILIDEVLTPDSSRFWEASSYDPGGPQASYDKQFVRDYLEKLDWDKTPPGPELPDEIVMKTREKYLEAFRRITGREFSAL